MKDKFVSRTCGSVRSSLSASARLATVGSEAAEKTFLRRQDEETAARRSPWLRASMRSEGWDWMKCPTQVNWERHRESERAKDADRLDPKGMQSGVASVFRAHTDRRTAGVYAGANSFVSSQPNIVNPTFRLRVKAGASVRNADGMAGRGCWKKRRPLCNGADRGCNITPPCKRADFQRVVRDERTRRTFTGGNSK